MNNKSLVSIAGLQIDSGLYEFINNQAIPGTGVNPEQFWQGLGQIIQIFAPQNQHLLAKRDALQEQIDHWHRHNQSFEFSAYKQFLKDIGYLLPEGEPFEIETQNVDDEIAVIAGPQLVVPVMNARFALNACNARWGSLYDALYGSDVIEEVAGLEKGHDFNPKRGAEVIEFGRHFLDSYFPLENGSYTDCTGFSISEGNLFIQHPHNKTPLCHPEQFVGYQGSAEKPSAILIKNNNLHVEVIIDADSDIGKNDNAGIKDIILEAAVTTIMDYEDSVAAVDAVDKTLLYRNWLGLMKGTLKEQITKNGRSFTRSMTADKTYQNPVGEMFASPGRTLMLVRNVGLHMFTDAILDQNGQPIPEGILDGMVTALSAMHDLRDNSPYRNSKSGSVYIVKPKLHGPEEVMFTDRLFAAIEHVLGLDEHTLKLGIMDEERRTSVNLMECVRAAKKRVIFINTGFLDRTGDEIHTSMEAGPMAPKNQIKTLPWNDAYEKNNVAVALRCGFLKRAQIGKGMWAMPDNLRDMMVSKIGHPKAGATTAWVPSPTAAVLHAIHYHEVNVSQVQKSLLTNQQDYTDDILQIPLLGEQKLTAEEVQNELENNVQGILGYVVRWVDQGIGCSKVPDIKKVPLMEDRATLRISSQHISNWLRHDVCSSAKIESVLQKMASVVDQQNTNDPTYNTLTNNPEKNLALQAARTLIFDGANQPNGYTEALLHRFRKEAKMSAPRD